MADFLHCDHITLLISGFSIKPHGGHGGDHGGFVTSVTGRTRRAYTRTTKTSLPLETFDWVLPYLWFRVFLGLSSGDRLTNDTSPVREMGTEKGSAR